MNFPKALPGVYLPGEQVQTVRAALVTFIYVCRDDPVKYACEANDAAEALALIDTAVIARTTVLMRPEHYAYLSARFETFASDLARARLDYPVNEESDKLYRWDALQIVGINQWLHDYCASYLTDADIDTALRVYFGHRD